MYKMYDFITANYQGYKGAIYKDNMFGGEFTNFSLYDRTGKEILHATLLNKEYTKEDVVELMQKSIAKLTNIKNK